MSFWVFRDPNPRTPATISGKVSVTGNADFFFNHTKGDLPLYFSRTINGTGIPQILSFAYFTPILLNTNSGFTPNLANDQTANLLASLKEFVLLDPVGRSLKNVNGRLQMTAGKSIVFKLNKDANQYQKDSNWVTLQDNDTKKFIRHSGFVMWDVNEAVSSPEYDFAYRFYKQSDGTYILFNDYGGGYFVGYDQTTDRVLIVPPGDSRVISWTVANPTQLKDDKYGSDDNWFGPVIDGVSLLSPAYVPSAPLSYPMGQNLIINAGFEQHSCTSPWCIYQGIGLPGWSVDNTVDVVNTNTILSSSGTWSLDLSGNGPGSAFQYLPLLVTISLILQPRGQQYVLSFRLFENNYCGAAMKTGYVALTGNANIPFSQSAPTPWTTAYALVNGTGAPQVLGFISTTDGGCGPQIDDISLSQLISSSPLLTISPNAIVYDGASKSKQGFDVALSTKPNITTTVTLTSSTYSFCNGKNTLNLTFTPENYNVPQSVIITALPYSCGVTPSLEGQSIATSITASATGYIPQNIPVTQVVRCTSTCSAYGDPHCLRQF